MKYFTVLSLLVVVLFTLSSGIHLADDEEMETIADAHNRVARALFINPSGIFAEWTRASTKSRSTRSSGSKRSPPPYVTPTASYPTSTTSRYPTTRNPATGRVVTTKPITVTSPVMGGMNVTSMFNSTICKQAYVEIIDQCITAQGLNFTEVNMVFSSNDTAVYMPLLKRLITILCTSSGCRYSILDAYRTCFLGSLGKQMEKFVEYLLDSMCKVNEFGSTCGMSLLNLQTTYKSIVYVCQMNRSVDCRRFDSPCRSMLQDWATREGCCALEIYQLYLEIVELFSRNKTINSSLSFPPDPWTACGLPSPGICMSSLTPSPPNVTASTKPPIVTSPTPKVPSKTIFLPRGKVWPYTDPSRFITIGKLKKPVSRRIAVLAANRTKGQSWAIAFDTDLQSKTQFLIVSYPVPKYIVKVVSTEGSSYRLALERIPKKRYVSGAPFNNPGSSYIFTSKSCYRNSKFSGQYLQHVATGRVLTHNSSRRIFLSRLQTNGYGQCWVYAALQEWLP